MPETPILATLPASYDRAQAELRWRNHWERLEIAKFNGHKRQVSFVIDSPPPTVSGSLHLGHLFSYTHQDILARQRRMCGMDVLYPMGWDDNGLPTERRVQNLFNVRAEPQQGYVADLNLEYERRKHAVPEHRQLVVSRRNFIELCHRVTKKDEGAFEDLFRTMNYSIDWSYKYTTIEDRCRRIAQHSFNDLYAKGVLRNTESPTMWDVDFQTAVAQAEVEDRTIPGAFHDLEFTLSNGEASFTVATTRPELLPACVGVVAHPEDRRYRHLFGKQAVTPAFFVPVPIFASEQADPNKGTGIVMVCTFGDQNDVDWQARHKLANRPIVGRDGRMLEIEFGCAGWASLKPAEARRFYSALVGQKLTVARAEMVRILGRPEASLKGSSAPLLRPPRKVEHSVRFYERGTKPLEYLTTRQWFVKLVEQKQRLIAQGRKIVWHPESMRKRYENWTANLNSDWCISRQRFFGVPIPVWYPIDGNQVPNYTSPIVAINKHLPVDPSSDTPDGYSPQQRGQPNGFVGENDVLDTWFTSSLSPQIVANWGEPGETMKRFFPMDMRPQSHEIIRTWAFYTIAKSLLHHAEIPWRNIVISGWILDPERKKMSKSKGNVTVPNAILEEFGSDAVRYWAGNARLGVDTTLDLQEFKIGAKLAVKLFNAAKFVFANTGVAGEINIPLDLDFVADLKTVANAATKAFTNFEYATALQTTEKFFWGGLTDNFLELVKRRARSGDPSASATLRLAISVIVRIIAPFMPVVTEEVWSWVFAGETGVASVHLAAWPTNTKQSEGHALDEIAEPQTRGVFATACASIATVRKAKSQLGASLGARLKTARLVVASDQLQNAEAAREDIANAACVEPARLVFSASKKNAGTAQIELA